jgi:hypothetical protein
VLIIVTICWCLWLMAWGCGFTHFFGSLPKFFRIFVRNYLHSHLNSVPLEELTAFMCHNLRLLFRIKEGLWISSDSFGGYKRTLLASKRFRNTFRYLRADQHPRSWRRIWESPDFYLVMCIRLCLARPI